MADGEHAHEILIIKRHGGGHEDAHHGGVWKIAFADFMTAMMAFFLVMWLISANDKTKATIASYFNPVKLVDTTTQPKGLEDAKAVESTAPSTKGAKSAPAKEAPTKDNPKAEAQDASKAGGEEAVAAKAKEKRLGAAVLDDPYAALAEIAGTKGTGDRASAALPAPTNPKVVIAAISRKGGEAFRDPFAPPPPMQAAAASSDDAEEDAKPLPPGGKPNVPTATAAKGEAAMKLDGATSDQPARGAAAAAADSQINDIKAQILAATKSSGQDKAGPQIEVRKAEGGVLVSLTDASDFSMFSSGSAVPERKVVLMMERIAQVLKAKPGKVVIRGFTDARPYKAGKYDNWHLSLDRAQVMHYMLVRGGFDEARIAHIEGYADHNPKVAADPTSPVNRRIEILLKGETP